MNATKKSKKSAKKTKQAGFIWANAESIAFALDGVFHRFGLDVDTLENAAIRLHVTCVVRTAVIMEMRSECIRRGFYTCHVGILPPEEVDQALEFFARQLECKWDEILGTEVQVEEFAEQVIREM